MKEKSREMIAEYFLGKKHKFYESEKLIRWKYSSSSGKFGISNLLLETLVEKCSASEVKLMLAILSRVPQSRNVFKSGCVRLVSGDYAEVCSRRVFGEAVKKFVGFGYFIETPDAYWYILNPRYINKLWSVKEFKEVKKKGDDKNKSAE
tara:strand:- start:113 stop:559 length:447 start_codon:yes stop_codon:yes gene_type:complete